MNKDNHKKRVICAMSGGVDSSVAAALLKEQGFDVVGIFMKLWAEKSPAGERSTDSVRENICCSVDASTAARAVAEKLSIPFYVVNFEKEFKDAVVDNYVKEYESGRTPNPCVICNRDIKGEILMRKVKELGGDYLATGHYAQIKEKKSISSIFGLGRDQAKKEFQFLQAKDKIKDQTYFLWTLTQEKLAHILFPCGAYTKPQIRKLAEKYKLPTAKRRESQGICFIPDKNVGGFLHRYGKNLTKPGPIVDVNGEKIGTHEGLINYTIGKRQGLGLGGPEAYYVIKLDSLTNTLVVGKNEDLFKKELIATDINWIASFEKSIISGIGARIRHGHPIEKCRIEKIDDKNIKVIFEKPQRAITPGQSIVFYKGSEVLGGAVIK
jgi:tRNA-specific 2-thiouridylase